MPGERSAPALAGAAVVDASVVVEYLVALTLTDHANALFRAVADHELELWAPDLMYPESVSALRRLVRLRSITAAAAEQACDHLLQLPLLVTGTRDLMKRAWALRESLTPYDACYAALAEAIGAPLVTADRKLARSLASLRAAVLYLGDLPQTA